MGSIIDGIFGSKSKESSSSKSASDSGNLAFPQLQGTLGKTLGFASSGGSALAALLGIPTLGGSGGGSPAYEYNYTYNPNSGKAGTGSGGSTASPYPYSSGGPASSQYGKMAFQNAPVEGYGKGNQDGGYDGSAIPNIYGTPPEIPNQGGYQSIPEQNQGAPDQRSALDNFSHSAGMDFIRDQGTKALESTAAGRGMLQSGATGKALSQFGTNLGQTYLNDYLNHVLDYSKLGTANANVLASAGNVSHSTGLASSSGVGGKNGLINNIMAAL